ncbi:hypothetical protein CVV38_01540 [Candidatus Peregrinibacteria bacterium HGW-Peregrinibacteria-1]|jgi:hypothetical protein|nr:MAG: hypothetical protein CVV38_01540 [Candidatus Peregrinibacteria bacterium HGW-Peregrinibacteria-1]
MTKTTKFIAKNLFSVTGMLIALFSGFTMAHAESLPTLSDDPAPTQNLLLDQSPCFYETPIKIDYSSQFISHRQKLKVEPGEIFRTKVFLKNTGNTPWFSDSSPCSEPHMNLGTDTPRDHESTLYTPSTVDLQTNWISPTRVAMDQLRVNPGEIASFTFWSKAPSESDIMLHNFSPVIDGLQWIEDSQVQLNLIVGDSEEDWETLRKRMLYANESGSIMDIDLNASKKLVVSISDQTVDLMLGEYTVRKFPVSTGAVRTPTPLGEFSIKFKQEVRVGQKAPHYIMPKFMWFRDGGYGFHALPSLRNDGGVFWNEAWDHIQQRVSHGCIRLLPHDADFLFDFTDVGTKVVIKW